MVSVSPENMTCGMKGPSDYCIQTHGIYRECDICDASVDDKAHTSLHLTDIHTESNPTWWQSTTMLENVHTQELMLTVGLGNIKNLAVFEFVSLMFLSDRNFCEIMMSYINSLRYRKSL